MSDRKQASESDSDDDGSMFGIDEAFSEVPAEREEPSGSRLPCDLECHGTTQNERQDYSTNEAESFSQDSPIGSLAIDIGIPADSLSPTVRIGNGPSPAFHQEDGVSQEKGMKSPGDSVGNENSGKKLETELDKALPTTDARDSESHSEMLGLDRQRSTVSGVSFFSDISSLTTATVQTPPAPGLRRASHVRIVSPGAFSVEGTVAGTIDLQDDSSTVASNNEGGSSNSGSPRLRRPDPPSIPAAQLLQAEIVDESAQREQMEELIEMNRALSEQLQALGGAAVRVSALGIPEGNGLVPIAEAQQVTLLQDDIENNVQQSVASSNSSHSPSVGRGKEGALPRGESLKMILRRPRNRWLLIASLAALLATIIGSVLSQTSSSNGSVGGDQIQFANETVSIPPTSLSPTFAPTSVFTNGHDGSLSMPTGGPSTQSAEEVSTIMPVSEQPLPDDESTIPPSDILFFPDTPPFLPTTTPTTTPTAVPTTTPTVAPTTPKMVSETTPAPSPTGLTTQPPSVNSAVAPTKSPTKLPTRSPTSMPTPRPTLSPTIGIQPIVSAQELRAAVDVYLSNPRSNSMAAKMYGWPIGTWDVSQVEDFSRLFSTDRNHQADRFNDDIRDWDVSRATDMSEMFSGASSFNQNLNRWETSRVKDMSRMFLGASSFGGVISSWDTRKVTSMERMFAGASSFQGDISKWSVSSVTSFRGMFNGATAFNSNISKWSISRASVLVDMFNGASSFRQDLCRWGSTVSERASVDGMFDSTRCEDRGDPNLVRNIPGPFCAVCSDPTDYPTISPTISPTTETPTITPTLMSEDPTLSPTTDVPSLTPSTTTPTLSPTIEPSLEPTKKPTTVAAPTENQTTLAPVTTGGLVDTLPPTFGATETPTRRPTGRPTEAPTWEPTQFPTRMPTPNPTTAPPTRSPSFIPTDEPSESPTWELDNQES